MIAPHDAKLGRELEAAGYPPSTVALARRGHWSDFKTPLATPKIDLVAMLRFDGHDKLAERVVAGEFDG